ncbi:hypothetical protein [Streptomyces sp. NPDC001492]
MTTAVREAPHHNTLTCYTNYGCRLPECVERKNAWARERANALRAGTWQPLEDAAPVREHVQRLIAAGLTPWRIADLVGTDRENITDLIQGRGTRRGLRHRTSAEFAAKVLAIKPAAASPSRVDATGAHRRIQALVAHGWPLLHIGRQLDMNRQRAEQILRTERIYAFTRDRITAGYPRLAELRPERNGVPRHKARQAREWAKTNRWAPPKYWADRMDDIDDPHFEPLYGVGRGELLASDARELFAYGVTVEQAAARLGVTKQHLQQELVRHPAPAATETALAA